MNSELKVDTVQIVYENTIRDFNIKVYRETEKKQHIKRIPIDMLK